jgi:hypothetical protein
VELLTERVTAATDYLLAAGALIGALRLERAAKRRRQLSIGFWGGGFAAIAAAAFLGGSWHGFLPRLTHEAAALLWKGTLAAAGVADFLLIAGAAFASVSRRRTAKWIVATSALKLAIYLLWALPSEAFAPVVADTTLTLLAISALQGFASVRNAAPSARWVLGGVVVSVAAAVIEMLRPPLFPPFGADAAYHVLQLGGLLLFLRGGLLFSDTTSVELGSGGPFLAHSGPIDSHTNE